MILYGQYVFTKQRKTVASQTLDSTGIKGNIYTRLYVTPENLHQSSFIFVMHNPINFTHQTGGGGEQKANLWQACAQQLPTYQF